MRRDLAGVWHGNVGAWTAVPGAGECITTDGVWLRVAVVNGNGTEDPAARRVYLEVK